MINLLTFIMVALLAYGALRIYMQSSHFQLKCIVSDVDKQRYCVRDRVRLGEAADLLAECTRKMGELVKYCAKMSCP